MKYEVKLTGVKAQYYLENKNSADKIIGIIAENQLSRKQAEDIFCGIRRLIARVPFIPKDEPLEFQIDEVK